MLAWTGGLINAVQTTMTRWRRTCIRPRFGRRVSERPWRSDGSAASSRRRAGAWALESGGASRFFALIAATMTVVFAALAAVRSHIPRALAVRRDASMAVEPARR